MNTGDDGMCCLLNSFNNQRIVHRLECRFKTNSLRTSFDFKSFLPVQSIKISHSSLNIYPTVIKSIENNNESLSSESSNDEDEEISSLKSMNDDQNEDDHLDRLAQWEPDKYSPTVENEDEIEETMNEDMTQVNPLDLPTEMPIDEVEDLLVTFVHHPIKTEPISYDSNLPQLDGQTDFLFNKKKQISTASKSRKLSTNEQKPLLVPIPTHRQMPVKKRVRSKSKRSLSMEHSGKTILDYFKVISRSSTLSSNKTETRSANYFDDCIVIDDDDEEVMFSYSVLDTIGTREKLLDHAVHSSGMRIKWLSNVELILLEHISVYQQQSKYSSLVSTIIVNFLKIFIIRDSDDTELSFYQFGLTSYLRYLLIDLPTYQHETMTDCFECEKYSLIINILFDLLFDLMEYDLCEISNREKTYRSSLIEDDYFKQLKLKKKNSFFRIKFIIYLIELIGIHRNKCMNKKEEDFLTNEKKIFEWIEDFIQHILYQIDNLKDQRLSICFNVLELSILFVSNREHRVKQMAVFLAKLCEENPIYTHMFLFDENLLADIRLLLINELIYNKFNMKLSTSNDLEEFFRCIQMSLKSANPIDEFTLKLIRSLFNTYADLLIGLSSLDTRDSKHNEICLLFRNQIQIIYSILINLSHDSNYFEQIKRTVILLRLLKSKWSRL